MRKPTQTNAQSNASISSLIRGTRCKRTAQEVMAARVRYWLPEAQEFNINRMIRRYAYIAKHLPAFIATAVLKSITNCWCTSSRFHDGGSPCRVCGEDGKDDLRHYINCKAIRSILHTILPKLEAQWGDDMTNIEGFMLMGRMRRVEQLLGIAIAHDLVLCTINTLRTRGQATNLLQTEQLMRARARQQAVRDVRARKVFQQLAN